MINIYLNGEPFEAPSTSLLELCEQLALTGKRYAIEINGTLVPKSKHANTHLQSNDKVEIVLAVGGG